MKCKWMIPMLAMAAAFVGCSSEDDLTVKHGSGRVLFDCDVLQTVSEVTTRAGEYTLPAEILPQADRLTLAITGSYTDKTGTTTYNKSWLTVADFVTENPDFEAGDYSTSERQYQNSYAAVMTYGDATAEGEAAPYFEGTSGDFNVYAGETAKPTVSVALANSCFTLAVTEWMLNYYDNLKLTIHTADSDFSFEPTTIDPSALIFVKAGAVLSFSGSAVKAQTGVEVTFPKTELKDANGAAVTTAAKTKYTISVDHGQAGAGTLSISFDDSFTEVPEQTVELNPDEN